MFLYRLVAGQYRKLDHVWFSVPQSMRHDFYQFVKISPLIPNHWVKVKQPDGTSKLESNYERQADETKHLTTDIPVSQCLCVCM